MWSEHEKTVVLANWGNMTMFTSNDNVYHWLTQLCAFAAPHCLLSTVHIGYVNGAQHNFCVLCQVSHEGVVENE